MPGRGVAPSGPGSVPKRTADRSLEDISDLVEESVPSASDAIREARIAGDSVEEMVMEETVAMPRPFTGGTVPASVLARAAREMDRYSARVQAEAGGFLYTYRNPEFSGKVFEGGEEFNGGPDTSGKEVWGFVLIPNELAISGQRERARHAWQASERALDSFMRTLEGLPSGAVRAVVHSHPYAEMGGLGWGGPSSLDIENKRISETEEEVARYDPAFTGHVEAIVWLPLAGKAGHMVSYDGEGGFLWRVSA